MRFLMLSRSVGLEKKPKKQNHKKSRNQPRPQGFSQCQETHSTLNETLNLLSNAIGIGLELTAPNLELGDPYKVRNFLFIGATIFDHLRGEGVWIIWFGLEFLDNYGKLFT